MKKLRFAIATLIVLALGARTSAGQDIGTLHPIQVVCMSRTGAEIFLWTDTGAWGSGSTPEAALEDMKAAAAGEIFLDTAAYLLLTADCVEYLDEVGAMLRPSCNLCLMEGEPNPEQIGPYLSIHEPGVTLMEYRAGLRELKTLKTIDGRMNLVP